MNRTQFTFYESFFKAVMHIRDDAERAAAYDAICAYALYGQEPGDDLPTSAAIVFELTKPHLDSARRKANSGKKGGDHKQSESKTEAKRKQVEAKPKQVKEKEQEEDKDKDKEQMLSPLPPFSVPEGVTEAFSEWLAYKKERREAYKPTGLKALETQVRNNVAEYGPTAVNELIRECMANGWRGIIWDRLKERRAKNHGFQTSNPFLEMLEEELSRNGQS